MFWGSRAPWGRSEDRCDGAGSEADGAKPPVKPGHEMPVLGVLVFVGRSALVKPPSSHLQVPLEIRGELFRFRPALDRDWRLATRHRESWNRPGWRARARPSG